MRTGPEHRGEERRSNTRRARGCPLRIASLNNFLNLPLPLATNFPPRGVNVEVLRKAVLPDSVQVARSTVRTVFVRQQIGTETLLLIRREVFAQLYYLL